MLAILGIPLISKLSDLTSFILINSFILLLLLFTLSFCNLENSNSFNTEYDHDKILYTYSFMYGKFANETLYLDLLENNSTSNQNTVHIKNFTFAMPSEHTIKNRKMFPSSIGLGFYAYNSNPTYNFLTQLKLKNVLNNTYFFFNFDDEFRGKLFLGVMPHDIYPKKYTEDKLYKVYTNIDNVFLFISLYL